MYGLITGPDCEWLIAEVDRLREQDRVSGESWNNTKRQVEDLFGADWDVARHDVLDSGNYGWATMVGVAVGELRKIIRDQIDEINELRERLHKCHGMANEINILVRENRELRAELAAIPPAPVVATDSDLRQALADAIKLAYTGYYDDDSPGDELNRLSAILAASQVPAMADLDPSMEA